MSHYFDWAERLLRLVLSYPGGFESIQVFAIPDALGIKTDGSEAQANEVTLAIDRTLRDLAGMRVAWYSSQQNQVGYPPDARRYVTEPLRFIWGRLPRSYLSTRDLTFLRALAARSVIERDGYVDVQPVDLESLYNALGWDWDRLNALAVCGNLKPDRLVDDLYMTTGEGSVRITYEGLVRALDPTLELLDEARVLLEGRHLRAAGCVAAVEIERRLKKLAGTVPSKARDPSFDECIGSAYKQQKIDQPTESALRHLATIRKLCVHDLRREPTEAEVQELLEGADSFLSNNP